MIASNEFVSEEDKTARNHNHEDRLIDRQPRPMARPPRLDECSDGDGDEADEANVRGRQRWSSAEGAGLAWGCAGGRWDDAAAGADGGGDVGWGGEGRDGDGGGVVGDAHRGGGGAGDGADLGDVDGAGDGAGGGGGGDGGVLREGEEGEEEGEEEVDELHVDGRVRVGYMCVGFLEVLESRSRESLRGGLVCC